MLKPQIQDLFVEVLRNVIVEELHIMGFTWRD